MEKLSTTPFNEIHTNEKGSTGLETAILLIAFVIAASVFAFAILSAGTFSTERGQETVLVGLNEVQNAMELRGQIVAIAGTAGMTGTVDSLIFTVANILNGSYVPIDPAGGGSEQIIIRYHDRTQRNPDLTWTVNWLVNDGDNLLEQGELAEITISNLGTQLINPLSVNTQFGLEIIPPLGNALKLVRITPPFIDPVNTLE